MKWMATGGVWPGAHRRLGCMSMIFLKPVSAYLYLQFGCVPYSGQLPIYIAVSLSS